MQTFLLTFCMFLIIIFAMSLGYIIMRKRIKGSCGGLASVGINKECACPEPCDDAGNILSGASDRVYQIQEPGTTKIPGR